MGKTRPTFRDILNEERGNWHHYRQMLRQQHRPHWERIWQHAEYHADASGAANPKDPYRAILLSICLGQQRQITALQDRVAELEGD